MKVYFHEIKDQDLQYAFTEDTPWIMEVVGQLDERMDQVTRPPNWKPRSRPTQVEFTLRRIDDLVHVTGKIKTQLFLLCSLCADGFHFPIQTQFHLLLTTSEIYGDVPRETSNKTNVDSMEDWLADDSDDEDEDQTPAMTMNTDDYEVSVVSEPAADLKEILHEQMALMIPMQPKPEKNEKDDCMKCGRNQLKLLPAQEELLKENPFAVLKNFKKKPGSDS